MKILHWNCQGLKRNPLTIPYLKDIRKSSKPDVMFLIETKNGFSYVDSLRKDLGFPNSFILPSDGLSGGLAIFWNDNVKLDFLDPPTLNYTDMYISEPGMPTFCLTYVYGDPDLRHRNNMWKKMIAWAEAGIYRSKPRLVLGDFNDIKTNDEKLGGSLRAETSFQIFRKMLSSAGLHGLKTVGGKFTWHGNRYSHYIQTKIDRAVATAEWFDVFPKAYAQLLDWIGSDHRPLLITTGDRKWKGSPLFRYDNRWRFNQDLKEELQKTWFSQCQHLPGAKFHEALKRCRSCLSKWKTKYVTNSSKKIQELKNLIQQAYDTSPIDFAYISSLKSALNAEYRMEEEYWKTKSRIQWLQVGDRNTRYFHEKTKQRRSFNRITAITDANGKAWYLEADICRVIVDYFTSLFTSEYGRDLDQVVQSIKPRVTKEMNEALIQPITEDELYQVVHHMARDKAPGPDGLNPGFYQDHWPTIRSGVFKFAKSFFEDGILDPSINHTHICLIPKIEQPVEVKNYRPISLGNVAYKILSKVLAERLKPWLTQIISENQSAFISGRMITDNILIAHELIHSLHTKMRTQPFIAAKVDISKAFDKIEWNFIEAVMKQMGFSETWCKWIMKCITTVTYSVLVNGQPVGKIVPNRGIRQGDPISPYIYLLCTEGLSSIIQHNIQLKNLHGFRASRSGPAISHLLFADDSLLFCKATEKECQSLLNVLHQYEKASGQSINFQKSAITFGKGINMEERKKLSQILGISKTEGFGRYLGLPEFLGRNKTNAFSFLAQRIDHKIDNWYNKFLSSAGKEVLIKSVITAIPSYSMSCFLLPMKIIIQITKAMRRFWWSSIKERNKIPWIAWKKITDPKQLGGLAIRDLKDFNVALLAKQSWRLIHQPYSLMARVLKAKYYPKKTLFDAEVKSNASYAWKSISQGTKLLSYGLKYIVGNGKKIQVWRDHWLPLNPPRPAHGSGIQTFPHMKVSDLLINGRWNESLIEQVIDSEDIPYIKNIRPSVTGADDVINWMYTKDGNYSVKSGYQLLRKLSQAPSNNSQNLNIASSEKLFSNIWKHNIPQKLKHFWWRSLHNAIPTAENLKKRKLIADDTCQRCGDTSESINHLLFQCRLSKEIWEHVQFIPISGTSLNSNSFIHNIELLLNQNGRQRKDVSLFPFIGWRIWKMRNDLLFNNKRWSIPDIINKAIIDQQQWNESLKFNQQQNKLRQDQEYRGINKSLNRIKDSRDVIQKVQETCCFVNASWISPNDCAGIGWILYDKNAKFLLKGMSAVNPTSTITEAKAEALRLAMIYVKRLGYTNVTFCGDDRVLYQTLSKSSEAKQKGWSKQASLSVYLQDLKTCSISEYISVYENSTCCKQ